MKQLNYNQQKLVEDHHNLIYSFMNQYKLSLNAVEDWYGCCAVALCKAAIIYNPNKDAAFSTLAYVCMHNEMKQIRRKQAQEDIVLSLDYHISEDIIFIDCMNATGDE